MLATLEFPDVDGPVIAATGQHTSIGTDLESLHDPLMWISHQRSLPSLPPLTSISPRRLQATAKATPGCSARACTRSPLYASHTKISPPSLPPPEASSLPSGLHATLLTAP